MAPCLKQWALPRLRGLQMSDVLLIIIVISHSGEQVDARLWTTAALFHLESKKTNTKLKRHGVRRSQEADQ